MLTKPGTDSETTVRLFWSFLASLMKSQRSNSTTTPDLVLDLQTLITLRSCNNGRCLLPFHFGSLWSGLKWHKERQRSDSTDSIEPPRQISFRPCSPCSDRFRDSVPAPLNRSRWPIAMLMTVLGSEFRLHRYGYGYVHTRVPQPLQMLRVFFKEGDQRCGAERSRQILSRSSGEGDIFD
jgi:hypothetical protein